MNDNKLISLLNSVANYLGTELKTSSENKIDIIRRRFHLETEYLDLFLKYDSSAAISSRKNYYHIKIRVHQEYNTVGSLFIKQKNIFDFILRNNRPNIVGEPYYKNEITKFTSEKVRWKLFKLSIKNNQKVSYFNLTTHDFEVITHFLKHLLIDKLILGSKYFEKNY